MRYFIILDNMNNIIYLYQTNIANSKLSNMIEVSEQDYYAINADKYDYKYDNGKIVNIGIKQSFKFPLDTAKDTKIYESKELLKQYLETRPLLFLDGKYYSVTAEKQALLNNALAVYDLKIKAGITNPILKWNATGEECSEWTITNLVALALAIASYVEPLVSKQQTLETQIKACVTIEELDSITIDYATV